MTQFSSPARPACIGPDWLRCTDGMAFITRPSESLQADRMLRSPDPWERLVCVTLQAQAGDFRNVALLLELAQHESDEHLRDCAITVFGLAAPAALVGELAGLFDHPDRDARVEAYEAAAHSCRVRLAGQLARRRGQVGRSEREYIMDRASNLLELDGEELELVDSPLDDAAFVARVDELVAELERRYGESTAIYRGEPLDVNTIVRKIAAACAEDEPELMGGTIASLFVLLEGLTGWPYASCLDDDCVPVLPKIAHTLNALRQSGRLDRLEPGRRYFFGHLLP